VQVLQGSPCGNQVEPKEPSRTPQNLVEPSRTWSEFNQQSAIKNQQSEDFPKIRAEFLARFFEQWTLSPGGEVEARADTRVPLEILGESPRQIAIGDGDVPFVVQPAAASRMTNARRTGGIATGGNGASWLPTDQPARPQAFIRAPNRIDGNRAACRREKEQARQRRPSSPRAGKSPSCFGPSMPSVSEERVRTIRTRSARQSGAVADGRTVDQRSHLTRQRCRSPGWSRRWTARRSCRSREPSAC
jgi:hypothetical protein